MKSLRSVLFCTFAFLGVGGSTSHLWAESVRPVKEAQRDDVIIEVVYVDPPVKETRPHVHLVSSSDMIVRKKGNPPYPVKMHIQYDDPEADEGFFVGAKGDMAKQALCGNLAVGYEGEKQKAGHYKAQLDVQQPVMSFGKPLSGPTIGVSYSIMF